MKNIFSVRLSALLVMIATGGLLLSSCSKKFDDNYLNPNNPVEGGVEAILPDVLVQMTSSATPPTGGGGGSYGPAYDGMYIGCYVQFWNYYSTNYNYDQMGGVYATTSDVTGSVWAMHYYGIGANAKYIIAKSRSEQKWDYTGVANAIFAWSWLTTAEEYGDIILKEAFDPSRSQFDYDPQSAVYDTVRQICDSAIMYLNKVTTPTPTLAAADGYFYGGDLSKWKKFVYAVKARSYAHLSNKAIYTSNHYADSVIKYVDLSFADNTDNAVQKWQGGNFSGLNNFYGTYRQNFVGFRQSAFIADLMTGANTQSPFTGVFDPRTPYLLNENQVTPITPTTNSYKGVVPGQGTSGLATASQPKNPYRQAFSSTSYAVPDSGRFIFSNLAPFPVMTAAELQFMKAEAAFRKGDKALALTAYVKGINLDFDFLINYYQGRIPTAQQITPATRAAYLADPTVVPTAANLTLSHIMLQRYISLWGYGANEAWTDLRRYHYTDIDPMTNKQVYAGFTLPATLTTYNNGKPVYRMRPRYNSEYLYNIPALQQIGALASDYHTKEQWFSQP
jgi:hypothetical protein